MDIKNLDEATYGGIDDPNCVCNKCCKIHVSEFRDSTSDEIKALGYKPNEYR